jgi:regulatory protein YycH of two-component signal transduction system YycFG
MNDLNAKVLRYQQTKCDDLFYEIYRETKRQVLRNTRALANSLSTDENTVLTLFDDAILYAVNTYKDGKDFVNYVKWKFKNKRLNFLRNRKYVFDHEVYEQPVNEDEDAATSFDFIVGSDGADDEYLRKQTEADQRQLIGFFLNIADDLTTAIIKVALAYQPSQTLGRPASLERYVADKLGIDKRTVSRKIERLAGKFDSKQYGNYRDYLVAL